MPSRLAHLFSLLQRRTVRQFVRYAIVGATNTVLDFSVYLALTRGLPWWGHHLVLAAAASFCVGVTSSFLLNTFWTFRAELAGWKARAPKFLIVALSGLAWNSVLLHLGVLLGIHDIVAKLAATAMVMLWNFWMQKTWTFKELG